jgi:hypothetical protein
MERFNNSATVMIADIPFADSRVIGLRISGRINKSEYLRVENLVLLRLKTNYRVRIYAEVESFRGISFGALCEDLKFGFGHMRDFDREAVVVAPGWVAKLTMLAGRLFKRIEIKHFLPNEKETARRWVQE